MPIYHTEAWDLTWEVNKSEGMNISGNAGVPIAAAAGLTIKLDAGAAFQGTVKNFWEFESLDTFIVQPTGEYVEDSVEDKEVSTYLQKRGLFGSSSLFMITGIKIARGAKTKASEVRKGDIHGGLAVEFPAIAEVGMDVRRPSPTEVYSTAQKTTDFVWALRLTKISKGFIDRTWSHEPFSEGATFGLDGSDAEPGKHIIEALEGEGFLGLEKVETNPGEDVFILEG
jgi:hypothetical protein